MARGSGFPLDRLVIGPFADGNGALIIVDAADADTVSLLFTHDPFAIADLIEKVRITEWVPVLGQFSA